MSEPQPTTPPRRDRWRLLLVAGLGAGVVLAVQAFNGHGGQRDGKTAGAPAPARAAAAATAGRVSAGVRRAAGQAAALRRVPSAPVSPKTLARLPASGPGLVLVADRPSPPFSQQNRLIIQGATIALDELNASGGIGGRPVRLEQLSLDGLAPAAVQGRLSATRGSVVLILPCDSNAQSSLAEGAARYGTLMLAPCDGDASLARRIQSYWPIGTAGNEEAAALAGYVKSTGYAGVFLVGAPELKFAASTTRYFAEAANAAKLGVSGTGSVSLGLGAAEVARVAAAIKAARPAAHAVFSALPPPYFNRLAAALTRDGVNALMLGTSALDTPLTLASGTAAVQDATFPSYGFLRPDGAAAKFAAAYTRRYGVPVGSFPGLGFETVGVLEEAIARAHSTDPTALERVLRGGIARVGAALFDRSYTRGASDHNPITSASVAKIYGNSSLLGLVTITPTGVPSP